MVRSQKNSIYNCVPIETKEGIPVFSKMEDRYVHNYQKIAADHIAAMSVESDNPFIERELWKQLDESTRGLLLDGFLDGTLLGGVEIGPAARGDLVADLEALGEP